MTGRVWSLAEVRDDVEGMAFRYRRHVGRSEVVQWAHAIAEPLMRPLGRRWVHVQATAELAARLAMTGGPADEELLVAAALVHDIGYADELAVTGFHPLDGARHLRDHGQDRLARLVAHHSNARFEAQLRGIEDYECEFPFGDSLLDHALTFCDMSTSPDGGPVGIEDRVAEIVERYGQDHVTAQAVAAGLPEFQLWRTEIAPLMTGSLRTATR